MSHVVEFYCLTCFKVLSEEDKDIAVIPPTGKEIKSYLESKIPSLTPINITWRSNIELSLPPIDYLCNNCRTIKHNKIKQEKERKHWLSCDLPPDHSGNCLKVK